MRRILIALAIMLVATVAYADDATDLAQLKSYFSADANAGNRTSVRKFARIFRIALDLGDAAIPVLVEGLDSSDRHKSYLAAEFLMRISGPRTVAALRTVIQRNPSEQMKTLLCFSLASTGSDDDIDFLIRSLEGEHIGNMWTRQAAFSLGVLRAERAREALQQTASKNSRTTSAAQEALRWMDEGPWDTPPATSKKPEEAIILAVLRNGVPRTEDKRGFHDAENKCRWVLVGKSWKCEHESKRSKKVPSISFRVLVAKDAERAVCFVSVDFGPLNASGYSYLLQKRDGKWMVIGMRSTWVS